MVAVTVSPKFQIVIPASVRDRLNIEAGQKLQVLTIDNRIELLPVEAPRKLRGFLAGIDTTVSRDSDRA